MCVVSMVTDWGQQQWPKPSEFYPTVGPYPYPAAPLGPTPDEIREFRDLLRKAREIDQKTGQPDCIDPAKDEWLKEFDAAVERLREVLAKRPHG